MELSPAPLAPLFDSVRTDGIDPVRQKGRDLCIRPTRAVIMSNTVLLDGSRSLSSLPVRSIESALLFSICSLVESIKLINHRLLPKIVT
jgi:hypothetical protein